MALPIPPPSMTGPLTHTEPPAAAAPMLEDASGGRRRGRRGRYEVTQPEVAAGCPAGDDQLPRATDVDGARSGGVTDPLVAAFQHPGSDRAIGIGQNSGPRTCLRRPRRFASFGPDRHTSCSPGRPPSPRTTAASARLFPRRWCCRCPARDPRCSTRSWGRCRRCCGRQRWG